MQLFTRPQLLIVTPKQKLCSTCSGPAYIYRSRLNTAETYYYPPARVNKQRKELASSVNQQKSGDMQETHVYYSRRALLIAPVYSYHQENAAARQVVAGQSSSPPAADVVSGGGSSSFDANVVMILAVLLCALICALGLNSIVRCALRCSTTAARMPLGADEQQRAEAAARRAQAGARRKALRAMPTLVYSAELKLQAAGGGPVCAVCLGDLVPGDRVRVLPKCNHGFHARCVDRWLVVQSTCPTCRQPLFGAPPKRSGCAHGGEADAGAFLVPLRPEGFITPYDF